MSEIKKRPFYYCIVPCCKNTTVTAPEKLFLNVPKDRKKRDAWTRAMKRDNSKNPVLSEKSSRHCCEDHFSLEEDLKNYWEWKLSGEKQRVALKEGVVPHRFDCQRKNRTPPVRKGALKRKRSELVEAASTSVDLASPYPLAECKNRWALVRDSFPEQTGPVRKKRPKQTLDDASYIQSIYEPSNAKLLGNASAETTSSQLMPLENSPWPVVYPNFPDHHNSSDPNPNIHIPEVKLEVGTFDEEDCNKAVYDPTTKHNNSDFSYVVPNSFDQSAVSSQRTSTEPNGAVVSAKPKQDQTEPEVVEVADSEVRPSDHPIETFFKSMAATVMTFPPHLMAIAKLNVCKLITELELRALSEKNRFEASQERINEMLSENIVEMSEIPSSK